MHPYHIHTTPTHHSHAQHTHTYTTPKEGNEGGMQMCLDRLFLEAEEERVEQENRERQQAEQVAAGVII